MNVVSHNCPTCSAPLLFDVDTQNWICDYCKKKYSIDDLMSYIDKKDVPTTNRLYGYECDNCGADIVSYKEHIATTCAYCGSPVIMKDKIEGEYKPDLITPFKHTKDEILEVFLQEKNNKKLTSPKFFNKENVKDIVGVYIPFYVVSAEVSATIYGDARVDADFRSSFMRKGTMRLENVPADAKTKLNDLYIRGLEPFEYEQFKEFEYPYLSGFCAENFDNTREEVYEEQIHQRISEAALEKVLKSGKRYLSYEILSKEVTAFCTEFKYALIPIWSILINYHGKDYVFYVNDQSKKIVGIYPVTTSSIVSGTVISLALSVAVYMISSFFASFWATVIAVILIAIIWISYISILNSHTKIKTYKNREYIKDSSFLLINSSDNDYKVTR